MSIDHKAFLFDYAAFARELGGTLYKALDRDDVGPLRAFIRRHLSELTDLATEEAPGAGWEESCRAEDGSSGIQRYADLALTKYYDLTDDLGLSYGFDALGAYMKAVPAVRQVADELICGRLFGPEGRRLDPSFMGTGLLSPEEVRRLHELLEATDWPPVPGPRSQAWAGCHYRPESPEEVRRSLERLRALYRRGPEEGKGLLLVDFDERGVGRL